MGTQKWFQKTQMQQKDGRAAQGSSQVDVVHSLGWWGSVDQADAAGATGADW